VTVWRDRGEHIIEAAHPGYQLARETIRYDRSASLSFLLHLQRANGPELQQMPSAAAAAPDAGAAQKERNAKTP
jgi:hypothetical protein